jgi:hypothetical protein
MSDFPVIDPKSLTPLRILQAEMAQNPDFLNLPECPYSPELKAFLAIFGPVLGAPEVKKAAFFGQNADKWDVLEKEAAQLYQDLKAFSDEIGKDDVAERMSYFRTATSLLEKIVGINERAVGLKHIHDFQQTVLAIFEDELTPDIRTRVMQRLRGVIDANEVPND